MIKVHPPCYKAIDEFCRYIVLAIYLFLPVWAFHLKSKLQQPSLYVKCSCDLSYPESLYLACNADCMEWCDFNLVAHLCFLSYRCVPNVRHEAWLGQLA